MSPPTRNDPSQLFVATLQLKSNVRTDVRKAGKTSPFLY